MALVDGGVYDNMRDQWGLGVRRRNERWSLNLKEPDEQFEVNSSAPMGWGSLWKLAVPLLGRPSRSAGRERSLRQHDDSETAALARNFRRLRS
jgi:hypothetical protein